MGSWCGWGPRCGTVLRWLSLPRRNARPGSLDAAHPKTLFRIRGWERFSALLTMCLDFVDAGQGENRGRVSLPLSRCRRCAVRSICFGIPRVREFEALLHGVGSRGPPLGGWASEITHQSRRQASYHSPELRCNQKMQVPALFGCMPQRVAVFVRHPYQHRGIDGGT